jgi:type IV pilus assembly protein PilC
MLFTREFGTVTLMTWSRTLRLGLDAGLSPVKLFKQQAKSGPAEAREVADDVAGNLAKGESVADALRRHRTRFPEMFLELVEVGEQAGRLPDVFRELETYFEATHSAARQFRSAMIWPALNYVGAILIVALMLLILGVMAKPGEKPFDPLGLGLLGPTGALIFLTVAAAFTAVLVLVVLYLKNHPSTRARFAAFGLKLPGVAPCVRAFALYRFSVATAMTHEAGMRADRCLGSAFRATTNAKYLAQMDKAVGVVKKGRPMGKALAACGRDLFPEEYLDAVGIGEVTGNVSEVMGQQAEVYREDALRKMKGLTRFAGGAVYALVGLLMIVVILRIVMSIGGVYSDAMKGL